MNSCALRVGMSYGAAAMENGMVVPQELNMELPCGPAIPLLGMCPKEWKAGTQAYIHTAKIIAALFTIVKKWKQPKHPLMGESIIYHNNISCCDGSTTM